MTAARRTQSIFEFLLGAVHQIDDAREKNTAENIEVKMQRQCTTAQTLSPGRSRHEQCEWRQEVVYWSQNGRPCAVETSSDPPAAWRRAAPSRIRSLISTLASIPAIPSVSRKRGDAGSVNVACGIEEDRDQRQQVNRQCQCCVSPITTSRHR